MRLNKKMKGFGFKANFQENILSIKMITNSKTPVGYFTLEIYYDNFFLTDIKFVTLFNPYNKSDDTYIADESIREECLHSKYAFMSLVNKNLKNCDILFFDQVFIFGNVK